MEFLDLNLLPQVVSGVDADEVPVRSAADNGVAARGWRRQGRKKPVGVREEGVEDLDTTSFYPRRPARSVPHEAWSQGS